jgi:dTDP-4-dehydrorhamnose 3,5-epimerase
MKRVEVTKLKKREDERGWLLKVLTQKEMPKNDFGEIYITTAHPGVIKANHYHRNTTEWFCVISGLALLVLEDIKSHKRKEILMGNDKYFTVKIPSGIAHAVKNVGKNTMYLVAIADRPYDHQQPDSYPYNLLS